LLNEILNILTNLKTKITFVWIPAHVNLSGNEIADQLAKAAILHTAIDLIVKFEARELYSMVDSYILNAWQTDWTQNQSLINYKTLQNTVDKNIKHTENSRSQQVLITRLWLGACGLNQHLFKIGCHADGLCVSCNIPETIEHYLIDCPHSNVAIALKRECLKLKIPLKLQTCLSVHALTKIIFQTNTRLRL
jgi:hypothetical protein